MKTPPHEVTAKALDEVHRQIDHARVNVTHADTKAALLAAGAIPLTALFLASPSLNVPFGLATAASWAAIAAMFVGIGLLGAVVWPRLAGSGGIRNGANRAPDQIIEKALRVSSSPKKQLEEAAEELALLATLAYSKFRRIQAAILCFAVAAVFMVAAAVM
ncbi:Pycsar system effector family protein [Glycomyces sp. NPDC047369]